MARPAVKQDPRLARSKAIEKKHADYTSEGVKDHDIFLLPVWDYQVMLMTTIVATVVRLVSLSLQMSQGKGMAWK